MVIYDWLADLDKLTNFDRVFFSIFSLTTEASMPMGMSMDNILASKMMRRSGPRGAYYVPNISMIKGVKRSIGDFLAPDFEFQ